ncbi:transcriptional regulator AsnC family [Klebsiella pneumoniae]|uniref:Transcriptional regulator AsnC family n=1 Tax=Klebsiella pneumoniae TaxID=573 RepID=A0A2X3C5Y3_KLEPN|nr:transcriptional regulator AsnC family [Klebsiella pneumoniae]
MNDVLDEIDRAILTCLTQDARVSLKVLSARVGADLAEHRRAGEAPGVSGVSFRAMGRG